MKKTLTVAALAAVCTMGAVTTARADTRLTPFAGVTFGGDAPKSKFNAGFGLTFMGSKAGFEFDMGYTPDFFNEDPDFSLIDKSNVTTLFGNLVVGPGSGKVQPYGVFGLGLIRSRVTSAEDFFDDLTTNDWGLSIGGGITGMMSDNVGIRGDIRYFRSLEDNTADDELDVAIGKFGFWRATAGVTFRF